VRWLAVKLRPIGLYEETRLTGEAALGADARDPVRSGRCRGGDSETDASE
jgi:hypothetical protein